MQRYLQQLIYDHKHTVNIKHIKVINIFTSFLNMTIVQFIGDLVLFLKADDKFLFNEVLLFSAVITDNHMQLSYSVA